MNPFNCHQASAHMASENAAATGAQRWAFRFHLAYCWFCKKYDRQLRVIARAFEKNSRDRLDPKRSESLKKRLLDELRRQ